MPWIRTSLRAGLAAASIFALSASVPARAVTMDFATLGIDPDSLVDRAVLQSLITIIGFGTQHRPYEPATALGVSIGLDFSFEVTLFKIPDSLFSSLSDFGLPASSPLPALPVAKIHLHKGFGERFDLGGSIFYLPNNWLVGGDAKITLIQGEEGPTYAFRFCYSYTSVRFNEISLSTKVLSPQLLVSRKMEFADPYLGVAMAYTSGSVTATISTDSLPPEYQSQIPAGVEVDSIEHEFPSASAFTGFAFGGVSLRIPHSGLRLTIEGAYDLAGVSTMGTKIGFTF